MEQSKLEEIKDEVLYAVKNHLFDTLEFENKVQEWFYGDENRFQEEEIKTFNLINNAIKSEKPINLTLNALYFMFLNMVARLTSDLNFNIKSDYFKTMKKYGIVKHFKYIGNDIYLTDNLDIEVKFTPLTKASNILENFPYAKDFQLRERNCHYHSMLISQMFKNKNVNVVTGNVSSINKDANFVHSWVEVKTTSGRVKVIDFNLNVIFYQEDYYRLRNVEVLSKISREELAYLIENDVLGNGGYLEGLEYKILLLYFDDIMKILKDMPKEKLSKKTNVPQLGGE